MPRVIFTSNLQRHVACPESVVRGNTVRAALQKVFADNRKIQDYVLDEQGEIRKHVFIFVEGRRVRLDQPVGDATEIYVMQALTGG